jgi:hypothetical protein
LSLSGDGLTLAVAGLDGIWIFNLNSAGVWVQDPKIDYAISPYSFFGNFFSFFFHSFIHPSFLLSSFLSSFLPLFHLFFLFSFLLSYF